jgi:hypothetical protein
LSEYAKGKASLLVPAVNTPVRATFCITVSAPATPGINAGNIKPNITGATFLYIFDLVTAGKHEKFILVLTNIFKSLGIHSIKIKKLSLSIGKSAVLEIILHIRPLGELMYIDLCVSMYL